MTSLPAAQRRNLTHLAFAILWLVSFLGARALLDRDFELAAPLRVPAALIPVIPTALFLWSVVRSIRSQDELERRINLEALAIAYPLAILLLMTLGLLDLAIVLPREDWSLRHVWVYLPLFYFVGVAIARRRYQ